MALISSEGGKVRLGYTQKYWNASRAWHGMDADGWDYGRLINELAALKFLPSFVGSLASKMIEDVVNDNHMQLETPAEVVELRQRLFATACDDSRQLA